MFKFKRIENDISFCVEYYCFENGIKQHLLDNCV